MVVAAARKLILWIVCGCTAAALLAPLHAPTRAAACTASGKDGACVAEDGAAREPVLTLSGALAQAMDEGPGFAIAALQGRLQALLEAEQSRAPVIGFTWRTNLQPALRPSWTGSLTWDLTDEVAVDVNVGPASPASSVSPASAANRLSIRFARTIWPPRNDELETDIEQLAGRLAELQTRQAAFSAVREVIEAFYQLAETRIGVTVAEQAVVVAVQRTAIAADRFAAGQVGLSEWQAVQQAERDAHIELRKAVTAHRDAAEQLARLLHGAASEESSSAGDVAVTLMSLRLVDDFPWSELVPLVQQFVAAGQQTVRERLLANDASYLDAVRAELQQAAAVDAAERASRVNWQVTATYALSWPFGDGGSEAASEAQAAIVGTLDLSRAGGGQREQALVSLELARLRTEQAKFAAIERLEAAVRAADDAQFVREMAAARLEQAEDSVRVVERRMELGFAAALEMAEAKLEVLRAQRELLRAEAALHLRWLEVARQLGVSLP